MTVDVRCHKDKSLVMYACYALIYVNVAPISVLLWKYVKKKKKKKTVLAPFSMHFLGGVENVTVCHKLSFNETLISFGLSQQKKHN